MAEENLSKAITELVSGLVKSFSLNHCLIIDELNLCLDLDIAVRRIDTVTVEKHTLNLERFEEDCLVLIVSRSCHSGSGFTPKWIWDAYESGATLLRLRVLDESIGSSYLRKEAQAAFCEEITLKPVLHGFIAPPALVPQSVLGALYNKNLLVSRCLTEAEQQVRPVAILATFNESDIIEECIRDLIDQGCDIAVVDNWSDDGTYEILERMRREYHERFVYLRRFPDVPASHTALTELVAVKEEIALLFIGRWIINADADEFRRSPFPGLTLAQALNCASRAGYSRVNFTVLNFRPVDDGQPTVGSYRSYFKYFELPDHASYFAQGRAWLQPSARVDLSSTGGHVANFESARDFPLRFWMKHIPIRSPLHAAKKISGERAKRWASSELERGWHKHYDSLSDDSYIWDTRTLLGGNRLSFDIDYSFMLSTSLSLYFSPVWTGKRAVTRRWVDAGVVELMNDQSRRVEELQRKFELLKAWNQSLDLGSPDIVVRGGINNLERAFTIKSQLNDVLIGFISGAQVPKRWPFEPPQSYQIRCLRKFFFRNNWYINRYPDVALSGMDGATHYVKFGAIEGRDPTSYFSTMQYMIENPDVARANMNPLFHFLLYGGAEGRVGIHRVI